MLGHSLQAQEVNIYSHRQPFFIEPSLTAFTEGTGIETKVLYSKSGLAQHFKSAGRNSPADVILAFDIARLSMYNSMDLLAETNSETMEIDIPARQKSRDNTFFALTKWPRIVATSKDRVIEREIMRIEDQADPKRPGRISTMNCGHLYNPSLMASMIAHNGAEAAEDWARGLIANLAGKPQGNDCAQVKAIFEWVCDVAPINTYFFEKITFSEENVQSVWPTSMTSVYRIQANADSGSHINFVAGGVAIKKRSGGKIARIFEPRYITAVVKGDKF